MFTCYGTTDESFSKQVALEMSFEKWRMVEFVTQEGGKDGKMKQR
jgi:hypothetical protein